MLSTHPEPKLDPRVKRTRELLEDAFMQTIKEKGFQAVSVQDITQRAGVNRATFYAHFEDKYDLLDKSIRQGFRQEVEKRTLNACHFTMDNLRNLTIAVCEFVADTNTRCKGVQPQFESLVETQVREQLHELLQNWIEQAGSRASAKTAATAASWALYGLALQWTHDKKPLPVERYADEIVPLIASNLQLEEVPA